MKKMNRKGFTLVELIIVIVVIGILAGLAAPKFMGVQRDAKRAAFVNDIDVVSTVATLVETEREQNDTAYGVMDSTVPANVITVTAGSDFATALGTSLTAVSDTVTPTTAVIAKIDPVKYQDKLGKGLKIAKLENLSIILNGKLAGTVVDAHDQANGVIDGKGVEYFGIDMKK